MYKHILYTYIHILNFISHKYFGLHVEGPVKEPKYLWEIKII